MLPRVAGPLTCSEQCRVGRSWVDNKVPSACIQQYPIVHHNGESMLSYNKIERPRVKCGR